MDVIVRLIVIGILFSRHFESSLFQWKRNFGTMFCVYNARVVLDLEAAAQHMDMLFSDDVYGVCNSPTV